MDKKRRGSRKSAANLMARKSLGHGNSPLNKSGGQSGKKKWLGTASAVLNVRLYHYVFPHRARFRFVNFSVILMTKVKMMIVMEIEILSFFCVEKTTTRVHWIFKKWNLFVKIEQKVVLWNTLIGNILIWQWFTSEYSVIVFNLLCCYFKIVIHVHFMYTRGWYLQRTIVMI